MNRSRLKPLVRSIIIISILVLSVILGYFYSVIWDKIDEKRYPKKYSEFVEKYSEEYKVPEYIIYSVIKAESSFDSSAVSKKGAIGLMQIMPDTFDWLAGLMNEEYETGMLYDPETNIKYGTFYLANLHSRYGKWDIVFAAYNAGPTNAESWCTKNEDGEYVLGEIKFKETKAYVEKVKKAISVYERLYYNK